MKLRNKKTGKIIQINSFYLQEGEVKPYYSLAEFTEDWEDYKEPKGSALDLMILTLTDFIENEPDEDKVNIEDCKQMLENLKAWKRLKDKGFEFKGIKNGLIDWDFNNVYGDMEVAEKCLSDFRLLFGSGE